MSKLIKVSDVTHAELVKIGSKAETFDDVIQRLMKRPSSQLPQYGEGWRLEPRKGEIA